MQTIVLTSTGSGAPLASLLESLQRRHGSAATTVLITHPLVDGDRSDAASLEGIGVLPARTLSVGRFRYIDAWIGGGEPFARWAVIPAALTTLRTDGPTLIISEHAWLLEPIDDTVASIAPRTLGLIPTLIFFFGM